VPRAALHGAARAKPALVSSRVSKLQQALERDNRHADEKKVDLQSILPSAIKI